MFWDTVLRECGANQTEMAELTGINQARISERLSGKTGTEPERWAIAVAAAGLMGLSEARRKTIIDRAVELKKLADNA